MGNEAGDLYGNAVFDSSEMCAGQRPVTEYGSSLAQQYCSAARAALHN